MKRFALIFGVLLMTQGLTLADEIIDSKGNITPCNIVTVSDGFIEYEKDGCLNSFCRKAESAIFKDYVDVRTNLSKKKEITRYTGNVIIRDFSGVKIKTENGDMQIPWYKVKFIGMYNPN